MRAVALALLAGCAHAPLTPTQRDTVACVSTAVAGALLRDVVGPAIAGERNGTLTIDARACGAGVLSEADAARLDLALTVATSSAVQIATLAHDDCVNEWSVWIGGIVGGLASTLPGALAAREPVSVQWDAPPECGK